MEDTTVAEIAKQAKEIILPSGVRISPETQALIITEAARAYDDQTTWLPLAGDFIENVLPKLIQKRKIPPAGFGKKAAISSTRKAAAIARDTGASGGSWLDTLEIVLDVAAGIEQNYVKYGTEVSDEKLCWDIIVDATLTWGSGKVSAAAGAAVGGIVGSCAGPVLGTLAGVVIGFGCGYVLEFLVDELEIDEKTAREWVKALVK